MQLPASLCLLALVLVTTAPSNEDGPPAITPRTLVGLWEAAPAWDERVYLLAVHETGPSFLVFTLGSEEIICRLVSTKFQHGKFILRFRSITDRDGGRNDVLVTGKGVASERWGSFDADLSMETSPEIPLREHLSFAKPPWTHNVPRSAKRSEKLLERAKRTVH